MKQFLLAIALVFSSSLFSSPSRAVEIENFRAGYVCPEQSAVTKGKKPVSRVCFETETIHITGQGICVFARKKKRCTWYGFEFDYTNAAVGEKMDCVSTTSVPIDYGNPEKVKKENVDIYEFTLKIKSGNGHFFNPQYSVFAPSRDRERTISDETICSASGKELFRFRTRTIQPKLDQTP